MEGPPAKKTKSAALAQVAPDPAAEPANPKQPTADAPTPAKDAPYDASADITGYSEKDNKARTQLVETAKKLGLNYLNGQNATQLKFWLQRPSETATNLQQSQKDATLDQSYTDQEVYNNPLLNISIAIEGLEAMVLDKQLDAPPPTGEAYDKQCSAFAKWGVPPAKELIDGYTGLDTDTVCDHYKQRYTQYKLKLGNYLVFGGIQSRARKDVSPSFLKVISDFVGLPVEVGEYPYLEDVTYGSYKIPARVDRREFLQSRQEYLDAKALFDRFVEEIKKPKPGEEEELPPAPEAAPVPTYGGSAFTSPLYEPRRVILESIKKTGGFTIVDPAYVPWGTKYDYLWGMTGRR